MSDFLQDHGMGQASKDLLSGVYSTDYDITPEMASWMRHMQRTKLEKDLPSVMGAISVDEFQDMFKVADEKTSSNPADLNYTIWKAMARSKYLSSILSILVSLPFIYGFPNRTWLSMIDVMLEKKPGLCQIHRLRIIGLLSPAFNTALKWFIGKQTYKNYEASNPSEEQHAYRHSRQSVDAAMIKLLSMETCRTMKRTMANILYDSKACFDRIRREQSNLQLLKKNVDPNLARARSIIKDRIVRRVKTGLGVSRDTYSRKRGEPNLDGEVQGAGDVPTLFLLQSDITLKVHREVAPGLSLESPNGMRRIEHNNIAYSDDNDGQVTASAKSKHPLYEVYKKALESSKMWGRLVCLTGGDVALHKCSWQAIAWELIKGQLQLIAATEYRLIMEDGRGAFSIIEFLGPDEPNVGLGFRLCPSGNQTPQFEHTLQAIEKLCGAISSAHLTVQEARMALEQRLVPKLSYPLHLTSFSKPQCEKINTKIRQTFLPRFNLNSHLPTAVAHGPLKFGGMMLPDAYTTQDQVQIPFIIRQLRWDRLVANDILVTLDALQLCTGFIYPIMEYTSTRADFIGNSLLLDIRRRLSEIEGSMWIEKAWTPKLQRQGDAALMEEFCRIPGITAAKLNKANNVRLWLRVVTIADLTNPQGTHIPNGMLDGTWQGGSDLL